MLIRPPPLNRNRSRRQRKKLRIGEFQELGFEYELSWTREPTSDEQNSFLERFLSEVIEARSLCLGGGTIGGFVTARSGSATEADRAALEAWLTRWTGVDRVRIGPLQDAWYDSSS